MELILGMDIGVFVAWLGTILATILCIVYGLYYRFVKKTKETQSQKIEKDAVKKKEEKQ